ncbi:alpha/beta hydrolase [Burkholderia cepacia]|uniref:alpha/beta hydrolase n=1 Tax=Burkholderia cepacia TaxID=292 RepID=UPI000A5FBCE1|nr:alpha/beta hydrolase [Burkholderia cepacia]MCA7930748.1 alpha/beta hydrolase fold domain-containing protein [Burkholderia cepacia]MCA8114342.1 alpha/beta hydrolase fold domain-containing protein [Burkholderia cepacia]MCA8399940.1 alpha/beta hydrolase fold domain-containing protein [Burkholderia cepacia]UIY56316.1 alpha/beta hydrolase fold domain-containing protein [Burkholderia cepacia]
MLSWKPLSKSLSGILPAHHVVEPGAAAPHRVADEIATFVQEMRTSYRALIPSAGTPDAVDQVLEIKVPARHPDRDIPARLYKPAGAEPADRLPVVLFVHGGGFVSGDLDTHDVLARAITGRAHVLVIAVDYRLAPEFPFPAGLEDVYAALQWTFDHASSIGGDPARLAICGDSAGGNLAAAAAMLARDRNGPALVAQWLMYPVVSLESNTPSWAELGDSHFPTRAVMHNVLASYVPTGIRRSGPLLAPLAGNPAGLPPALIQVGQLDPLRDESIAYAHRLNEAGTHAAVTVYDGQAHGFIQFFKDKANHSHGEIALDEGIRFLRAHTAPGAAGKAAR